MEGAKGNLIVVSGPSGVGKGTIIQSYMKANKAVLSVSCTTRNKRDTEVEGVNYFFKTKEDFKAMVKNNEFLEYVDDTTGAFCDNFYGTPKSFVLENLGTGSDVILEIEYKGALNVKKNFPNAQLVFILPPSAEELKTRIIGRKTEDLEAIIKRYSRANDDIAHTIDYDYFIVNNDLQTAVNTFSNLLNKLKTGRENELLELSVKNNIGFLRDYINNLTQHTSKELNSLRSEQSRLNSEHTISF